MTASTLLGTGRGRGLMLNMAIAQETNLNLGGGATAEHEFAGIIVNVIPKDGGNAFSGFLFANGTNNGLQSDNLSDTLRGRELTQVNTVRKIWDLNVTLGGPVRKDRLCVFAAARHLGSRAIHGVYRM